MSVAASRPPAPVVAPAPASAPTPADREPGAAPFADMLRQSRGVERRPQLDRMPARDDVRDGADAAAPTANASMQAAPGDDDVPAPEGSLRSDAGRARARAGAAVARPSAARSSGPSEANEHVGASGAAASVAEDDEAAADEGANAVAGHPAHASRPDPRPSEAELRFGPAARRFGAQAARDAGSDAIASNLQDSAARGDVNEPAGALSRTGRDAAGRAESARGSAGTVRDGEAEAPSASFARILGDAKAGERPALTAAAASDPAQPLAGAAPTQDAHSPAAAEGASATQPAGVTVPIDSPEFPAALGVQVSLLVKDGVQQAELHLNPAETGPVSIAITLEGTQAHVEFGADLAATRQAIENGLPALASALRDAGFTLAGGGVAQHSRSGAGRDERGTPDEGRSGARHGHAIEATPATVQRSSHRVAAGAIDLYA